jgi:anti-sigma regulatory factor (Ser/Thr protein kinase)
MTGPRHSFVSVSRAPHDASARVEVVLPARADQVAVARHAIDQLARESGLAAARRADVALAVGEACANAVMHAYRGDDAGLLRVRGEVRDGRLEVAVTDFGGGLAPRPDSPGLGLGLPLMASLATALQLRPAAGGGTEAWMCFAPEPPPPRPLAAPS